jgi:hypothetical protein
MASAWGSSWGASWANSWGLTAQPQPVIYQDMRGVGSSTNGPSKRSAIDDLRLDARIAPRSVYFQLGIGRVGLKVVPASIAVQKRDYKLENYQIARNLQKRQKNDQALLFILANID